MRTYDPGRALISIHIPKSGGTSFKEVLMHWFGRDLYLHYYDEENNLKPKKIPLEAGICIHGHFNKTRGFGVYDYYPEAEQYITVLREPLELHLSNYFFIKKNVGRKRHFRNGSHQGFPWKDVDDYLDSARSFILIHFPWEISRDNYKRIFEKYFIHMGCTDQLQEFVNRLAVKLGKESIRVSTENISERDERPSPRAVKTWRDRHRLEYAVYDFVRDING
jgi:hypothetical protein